MFRQLYVGGQPWVRISLIKLHEDWCYLKAAECLNHAATRIYRLYPLGPCDATREDEAARGTKAFSELFVLDNIPADSVTWEGIATKEVSCRARFASAESAL